MIVDWHNWEILDFELKKVMKMSNGKGLVGWIIGGTVVIMAFMWYLMQPKEGVEPSGIPAHLINEGTIDYIHVKEHSGNLYAWYYDQTGGCVNIQTCAPTGDLVISELDARLLNGDITQVQYDNAIAQLGYY